MPKKEPTINVKFTRSELDLIFTEMNSACDNGAEDPDYPIVRDKAKQAQIELIRRLTTKKT